MAIGKDRAGTSCPSKDRGQRCIHYLEDHPRNSEGQFVHSTGGVGSWVTGEIITARQARLRIAELDEVIQTQINALNDRRMRIESCEEQIRRVSIQRDNYSNQLTEILDKLRELNAERTRVRRAAITK